MNSRRQELKRFIVFALIPLSIFILVLVVPFSRGVFFSFTDWDGFEVTKFVGLENYIETFQNQSFWASRGAAGVACPSAAKYANSKLDNTLAISKAKGPTNANSGSIAYVASSVTINDPVCKSP